MGDWTFFSNYGHVLVCLARNNRARLRDVAQDVGITERAVQKIVKDLQEAGYITVRKQGRCNRYRINRRKTLRHGLESHVTISRLLALVSPPGRVDPGTAVETPDVDEVPFSPETEAVPATVIEPAAESIAEPVAEAKPEAAHVPETEPEPEPEPSREPAPEPNLAVESQGRKENVSEPSPKAGAKKRKKEKGPIDIEQQGSLF